MNNTSMKNHRVGKWNFNKNGQEIPKILPLSNENVFELSVKISNHLKN